ncbi:MAG: tetratricopeptide repeat protein [Cyclobacteriaceae bacterium]|nr:tetratricopeptide repeat protein [Cyclobacteriaceae bacterium]
MYRVLLLSVGYVLAFFKAYALQPDSTEYLRLLHQAKRLQNDSPSVAETIYLQAYTMVRSKNPNLEYTVLKNLADLLYTESKFDSAAKYYILAWKHAQKTAQHTTQLGALMGAGESFMRLFKGDTSRYYLEQALIISKRIGAAGHQAGIWNNLANNKLNENQLEESLKLFIRSARMYDSLKETRGYAKALSNIGNIHYRLGHLSEATANARLSLQLGKKINDASATAYAHKLLGWIARKQGDYSLAVVHYDSAIQLYRQIGMKRDLAELSISVGNALYDLNRIPEAILHYKEALHAVKQSGYRSFLPYCYSGLAYANLAIKNYNQAHVYSDSLAQTAKTISAYLLMDAYEIKNLAYEGQNNLSEALKFIRYYQHLKDSLTQAENRTALEDALARHETELKQKEIEQLKAAQQLSDSRSKILQISLTLFSILVVIIALLIINRYRVVNKSRRQIELERMRTDIARDLHDDMGSALSSIHITSTLGNTFAKGSEEQQAFQRIRDQAAYLLEAISDLVWSVNPAHDEVRNLIGKMREFAAELLEVAGVSISFIEKVPDKNIELNPAQRKNLLLIFKEAVNNIARHSKAALVQIEVSVTPSNIAMRISDNGMGFDKKIQVTGNGLKNLYNRAKELNGSLEIETAPGKGTTLILNAPLP